jgi:hypothetical protein
MPPRLRFPALLFVVACNYAQAANIPEPKRVDLILLAGQSNADGRAPAAGLPPELREPCESISLYSHVHGEPSAPEGPLGRLGPLMTGRTQFPAGAFGPEISLGRSLAASYATRPDRAFVIVKYAKGGSSLARDWRAGGDATESGDGHHYRVFQRVIRSAVHAVHARFPGAAIHFTGIVWVQGETDADTDTTAEAYGHNLSVFAKDLRATLDDPKLRIVIARLSGNQLALSAPDAKSHRRHQLVRAAQTGFSDPALCNYFVDTDGPAFTFLPDLLHYDAAGQIALGNACARMFSDL